MFILGPEMPQTSCPGPESKESLWGWRGGYPGHTCMSALALPCSNEASLPLGLLSCCCVRISLCGFFSFCQEAGMLFLLSRELKTGIHVQKVLEIEEEQSPLTVHIYRMCKIQRKQERPRQGTSWAVSRTTAWPVLPQPLQVWLRTVLTAKDSLSQLSPIQGTNYHTTLSYGDISYLLVLTHILQPALKIT